MPKNPFSDFLSYEEQPNRNNYDLSFTNNGTYNFGAIYPVMCAEMLPGESIRVRPSVGARFFPMVFPVQTRMRCFMHAFYVRKRNLWKDYVNFISGVSDLREPIYIPKDSDTFRTRSLEDYMNVPTVSHAVENSSSSVGPSSFPAVRVNGSTVGGCTLDGPTFYTSDVYYTKGTSFLECGANLGMKKASFSVFTLGVSTPHSPILPIDYPDSNSESFDISLGLLGYIEFNMSDAAVANTFIEYGDNIKLLIGSFEEKDYNGTESMYLNQGSILNITNMVATGSRVHIDFSIPVTSSFNKFYHYISGSYGKENALSLSIRVVDTFAASSTPLDNIISDVLSFVQFKYTVPRSVEIRDLPTFPYATSDSLSDTRPAVNVLPFRAYESIYNAFYRDIRNNPLIGLNGQPEYNKYILYDGDSNPDEVYKLRYRNWEQDFLTTASQTPQQGLAPLVGITSTGKMSFVATEDGETYTVNGKLSDDGNSLIGVDFSSNVPNSVARSLVDFASSGISINDFRNVNALQRWLETNLRVGLRYRGLIKGHYGVTPSYSELDMPEFIGGFTSDIDVNPVTQTSPLGSGSEDTPLGWQAGQGSTFRQSEHSFEYYADEAGYFMVLMSFAPVPVYTQLMPKMFLKRDVLDYYYPAFGHIGLQPITYAEVMPVETSLTNDKKVTDTFGYQRAWYDYLARVDEAHGLLRTELRNFIVNRTFASPPVLGADFLEVRPDQLSDIFAVTDTENSDKIIGQVYFDITAKRIIPMVGIPRLE